MRSTRATELAREWPMPLVCKWVGHDAMISQKHYQQVTAEDYAAAATNGGTVEPRTGHDGACQELPEYARALKNREICRILTKVVKNWQEIQYPRQESNL